LPVGQWDFIIVSGNMVEPLQTAQGLHLLKNLVFFLATKPEICKPIKMYSLVFFSDRTRFHNSICEPGAVTQEQRQHQISQFYV
jgi:hypothetical protein